MVGLKLKNMQIENVKRILGTRITDTLQPGTHLVFTNAEEVETEFLEIGYVTSIARDPHDMYFTIIVDHPCSHGPIEYGALGRIWLIQIL